MKSGIATILDRPILRGALAATALLAVVVPGLAAGLHAHEGHVGDDCDICLQLAHMVFDMAEGGPEIDPASRAGALPEYPRTGRTSTSLSGDPARAPPGLS